MKKADDIPNLSIPFSIRDLAGKEILPAGSELTKDVIGTIVEKGRQQEFTTTSLLKHGSIRTDLERFMAVKPYDFIFGGPPGIRNHLEKIGEVPIPQPLMDALDRFREHDFYTYRHSLIVFALTTFMMDVCYKADVSERNVLLVGPTHDIGKLCVPKEILVKSSPLARKERALLEHHPVAGYVLNSYYLADQNHPAAWVALNHHERRDGSGYPSGVAEVDPLVEMVAICDVYDALISSRPYRPNDYDNRTALEELIDLAEKETLNRHCVKALVGRNRTGYPTSEQLEISLEKRGTPPSDNCYGMFEDEEKH